jgi:hypothetical protein
METVSERMITSGFSIRLGKIHRFWILIHVDGEFLEELDGFHSVCIGTVESRSRCGHFNRIPFLSMWSETKSDSVSADGLRMSWALTKRHILSNDPALLWIARRSLPGLDATRDDV